MSARHGGASPLPRLVPEGGGDRAGGTRHGGGDLIMAAGGGGITLAPNRDALRALYPRAHHRPGLLDRLEDPRADTGMNFADDDGGWSLWEYPRGAPLPASPAQQI